MSLIPRDPNRFADTIVFGVCLILFVGLYTISAVNYGFNRGVASVAPCSTQKMRLPESRAEKARFVKWYHNQGELK